MQNLVILDIDDTLIKGQSQKYFLKFVSRKKLIGFLPYLKILFWFSLYKARIVKDPKKIMQYAYNFLKNMPVAVLEKIINDFFDEDLKKYFFKEGLDIIKKHKNNGDFLLIVTNSIEPIVKKISEYLSVDDYISTKLDIVDNKYTGRIAGEITYGKNKVVRIKDFVSQNGLNLSESWAYGDHMSDLPILEMVKHPIATNPDKILNNEAIKRNWQILHFNLIF